MCSVLRAGRRIALDLSLAPRSGRGCGAKGEGLYQRDCPHPPRFARAPRFAGEGARPAPCTCEERVARCAKSRVLYTDRKLRCALDVAGEVRHAALPLQLALLEHIDAVGDQFGEMDVLLRQQHRQAFLLQVDDGRGHLLDDHRRDALGRLVEQHQQRVAHQRARHRQHLLLAAAHVRAEPVGHAAEVGKQLEQLRGRPRRRGPAVGKLRAAAAADVEIFQHRQVGEDAPVLRHEAERRGGRSRTASAARCPRRGSARVPARRAISAISAFMVVDLPAPLRPISATTSPRPTWNDRSNRICAAPYQALRPLTSRIGSLTAWPPRAAASACRCRDRPPAPAGCRGSPAASP